MSIIHVNQIKNQITKILTGLVDVSDVAGAAADMRESFFLTRGLAAYVVHYLSGASPEDAAASVTDGGDDNGIDAIYYDKANKRLYLVQTKWIYDGTGEPSNGDIKKFVAGVRDLFNLKLERFNSRIRDKEDLISSALADPNTRYEVVVAYTGSNALAEPSRRDLDDLAEEMNDTSDVVYVTSLRQSELHNSLTSAVAGDPINLEIGLKSWGRKDAPHEAFYGQVSADQIAAWWATHRGRLFAHNLRNMLGETDVNTEIRQTLEQQPDEFWYFNNGITMVAQSARRAMAGGGGNDFATVHCDDVSIVNGAQTVGTIGKFGEADPSKLGAVYVPLRVIVRGDNNDFGNHVTRTNNRQNRIENRDFVALDPVQARIRTELAIDGIDYQPTRSETVSRSESSFDLVEATTALACASGTPRLAVQLKREIGKLWDDISKGPYKELFNASVPGLHAWRCVQVQRRIDRHLDANVKSGAPYKAVAVHGNRLLAALVFQDLPVSKFGDPAFDLNSVADDARLAELVGKYLAALSLQLDTHYPNSIIPTLFKNLNKCEHLTKQTRDAVDAIG